MKVLHLAEKDDPDKLPIWEAAIPDVCLLCDRKSGPCGQINFYQVLDPDRRDYQAYCFNQIIDGDTHDHWNRIVKDQGKSLEEEYFEREECCENSSCMG